LVDQLKGNRDKNALMSRKETVMQMHCLAEKDRDENALKSIKGQG
jgi:hypothetical protein